MIVLGIDPGLSATGYGVVVKYKGGLKTVEFGSVRTDSTMPLPDRLLDIVGSIGEVAARYRPNCASVEKIFMAQNVDSAVKLSHVRGALLYEMRRLEVPVFEYDSTQIKKAVVGYGHAAKFQVVEMVRLLLRMGLTPVDPDAGDALAAAVCHLHSLPPERLVKAMKEQ